MDLIRVKIEFSIPLTANFILKAKASSNENGMALNRKYTVKGMGNLL